MNDLRDILRNVFKKLVDANDWDYFHAPIPCDLDREIQTLVNLFAQSDLSTREQILSMVSEENCYALIVFSSRWAALGVREHSRQRLLEGLIALLIEGYNFDWRDSVKALGPLYHSAAKIRVDPVELFAEAASYARSEVAEVMSQFPYRKAEGRSLQAMGYKEIYTPDGFRYEQVIAIGQ
jgi:hypothetical protein